MQMVVRSNRVDVARCAVVDISCGYVVLFAQQIVVDNPARMVYYTVKGRHHENNSHYPYVRHARMGFVREPQRPRMYARTRDVIRPDIYVPGLRNGVVPGITTRDGWPYPQG